MKLLLENWRRYLNENASPDSALLMQSVAALEDYASAEGGGLWPAEASLLAKTNDPRVVKYSGPAYRGVRIDNLKDLLDMLDAPAVGKLDDTYVFRGEIPWFNEPMLKAIKGPGQWVKIVPPSGTKATIEGRANQQSFTKSFERAQVFASGQDKAGGKTTEFFKGTPNLEVILATFKGEPPFIDVNETLAKNINHLGKPFEPEFPEDVEVLSIGDRTIDEILIKVKPGAESNKSIQDMLRWIEMANQTGEQVQV